MKIGSQMSKLQTKTNWAIFIESQCRYDRALLILRTHKALNSTAEAVSVKQLV